MTMWTGTTLEPMRPPTIAHDDCPSKLCPGLHLSAPCLSFSFTGPKTMLSGLIKIAFILLVLASAGCVTSHKRLYDGPAKGSTETALLKIEWNALGDSARFRLSMASRLKKDGASL